jgi:hypothetical protein
MSTKKRKQPDSAPASSAVVAAAPAKHTKPPQVVAADAFPGVRNGFLLAHEPVVAGGGAGSDPAAEELEAARADSTYISTLIALIPSEFYVPKSEEEKEASWNKYSKVRVGVRGAALVHMLIS